MEDKAALQTCPYCGFMESSQNESVLHLPLGTILENKYLIGRALGQGGFGITYLALDMTLNVKVAIKEYFPQQIAYRTDSNINISVFKTSLSKDFNYGLSRFLDEAKTLARFTEHPNIVSVRDYFSANGTAYLVMNYYEGVTLLSYLHSKGGRISPEQAVEIFMPVLDALKEVHSAGILHRDISPDNILIDLNGRVILIDFGAARQEVGGKSKSLSLILKAGYAPEEQHRSRGIQGPWTDVYAVTATIYRTITGEVPPESIDRLVDDVFALPSQMGIMISEELEAVLIKGMAVLSTDRYQSIDEMQQAFLNYKEIAAFDDKVDMENCFEMEDMLVQVNASSNSRNADQVVSSSSEFQDISVNSLRKERQEGNRFFQNEPLAALLSVAVSVLAAFIYLISLLDDSFNINAHYLLVIGIVTFLLAVVGFYKDKSRKILSISGMFFSTVLILAVAININSTPGMQLIPPGKSNNSNYISVPANYSTIQAAIDNAVNGQVIVVSEGIYQENIDFMGKDIVLRSTDPENIDIVARTVIDGGNKGSVVSFKREESRKAVLSGFTITGGSGTREKYTITSYDGSRMNFDRRYGGGVLITGKSEPTISNNIIIKNTVRNAGSAVLGVGGGIAVLDRSSPLIENNIIKDNYSEAYGGGIAVWYKAAPIIVNNIIEENRAGDIAGGILVAMMSSPDISNNTIQGNHSSNWSGGLYVAHMSEAKIINNLIAMNTATDGAGIFVRRADSVIVKGNRLLGNKASRNGGAIYIDNRATVVAENNIIENNAAKSGGVAWVDNDSIIRLASPDNNKYQGNSPNNIYKR